MPSNSLRKNKFCYHLAQPQPDGFIHLCLPDTLALSVHMLAFSSLQMQYTGAQQLHQCGDGITNQRCEL